MKSHGGIELKLMRVRLGVRQYRVAQVLGIPPSSLCDIENGRRPVGPIEAAKIAEAIRELAGERLPWSGDDPVV